MEEKEVILTQEGYNKLEEELLNTYKLKLNRKKQYYQVVKMALTFVVIDLG